MNNQELLVAAHRARNNAYALYSHFKVGAALLAKNGTVYLGCNVENASFGATTCAERSAFASAIADGAREFAAIAIVGGKEHEPTEACAPCGICRQVIAEFCNPDFRIILENTDGSEKVLTLSELLPYSFSLSK